MEYPKINSLWKRHGWYLDEGKKTNPEYQAGRQSFIVGDYAVPEFGNIKRWQVQEKIDGTNIRMRYFSVPRSDKPAHVGFFGRTDNADIPKTLYNYLQKTFTMELLQPLFNKDSEPIIVWLFGEGYGPKIQSGGNYRNDVGFILFDVKINEWWLEQSAVKEIAEKLGIPYAPIIGTMTEDEIISYIKSKPRSLCSINPQVMEGIIARPEPLLLQRNGKPLMMKLKCKEF